VRRKAGERTLPRVLLALVSEPVGGMEGPLDHRARLDAVGAGGVVEHETVVQRWDGDAIDVVVGNVGAAVYPSRRAGVLGRRVDWSRS
jgi:hypothetical protein